MDNTAPASSRFAKTAIIFLVLLCVGLAIAYFVQRGGSSTEGEGEQHAKSDGPTFLNAAPEIAYTGSQACAECHEAEYASYRADRHSRSLSLVDPAVEPLPTTYHHEASDLYYRLYDEGGQMRVEERLAVDATESVVLADHALTWQIGTGTRLRSYLCEVDGFAFHAPVTWYASKQAWEINPGYDRVPHPGFSRAAVAECLACHADGVEALDGSLHRLRLHGDAIGCERCHGPGAPHDALRRGSDDAGEGEDLTIAHPDRMSRQQKMDLCAQCHMDHLVTVTNPGKRPSDWRPGMAWNEIQVTYRLAELDEGMASLGHVDPLRSSACFQGSDDMTCLTCHSMHARPPQTEAARKAWFNGKCLTCHQACGRVPDEGPGTVPPEGDDCVGCHMPKETRDDAHIAFTKHRIEFPGIEVAPPGDGTIPTLEALGDVAHLPKAVRERNLGLAYMRLAWRQRWPTKVFKEFRLRAKEHLDRARDELTDDPDVLAAVARLELDDRKRASARKLARSALDADTQRLLDPGRRGALLALLVDDHVAERQLEEASALLNELASLRRDSSDAIRRIEVHRQAGDIQAAVEAAREALAIWPNVPETHYKAAEVFGEVGDAAAQALHNSIGARIQKQESAGGRRPR